MQRETLQPLPGVKRDLDNAGFHYVGAADNIYFADDACYRLTPADVNTLEEAAAEVHKMCVETVGYVVKSGRMGELGFTPEQQDYIRASWNRGDPAIIGRIDFAYDGSNPPKMLEYNGDSVSLMFEGSVVQDHWLRAVKPGAGQMNDVEDALVAAWSHFKRQRPALDTVCFASNHSVDYDRCNTSFVASTAAKAGLQTQEIDLVDVGINEKGEFVDLQDRPIAAMYKMHPWERALNGPYGPAVLTDQTQFLDAPWTALLSSKGILPILHERYPDHPNLLPAFRDASKLPGGCVAKPVFGLGGKGVTIATPLFNESASQPADTGRPEVVYQAYTDLGTHDGYHPVFGVFVANDDPAGLAIREDKHRITRDDCRFVPHYVGRDRPAAAAPGN